MSGTKSQQRKSGLFEKVEDAILSRRKTVVVVWILAILLMAPAVMAYSNYVSYSGSTGATTGSESARASQLLSQVSPQNSSLVVVVSNPTASNITLANSTLDFQSRLSSSSIPYVSSTASAFSAYASLINNLLNKYGKAINNTYTNVSTQSRLIFEFPAAFYKQWASMNFSNMNITAAAENAGFSGTSQQKYFLSSLNSSLEYNSQLGPYYNVMNATKSTAFYFYNYSEYTAIILSQGTVDNYTTAIYAITSTILASAYGVPISEKVVYAAVSEPNPGDYYVRNYGLAGAPGFIFKQYVSRDNTTYLVTITLNVSDSFRGTNNFYPAQSIVPQIRSLTDQYFGGEGSVTGNGAISYDLQVSQGNSFIGFIFTFVFLAIIVGLVLRSYISPILALVLASISILLGYFSVFVIGSLYEPVNYIVTYTLMAVLLGVSTDYLLFILSRFREEASTGKPLEQAIRIASVRSGSAIIVSGLTVATSLGTMFFVTGLNTWGPTLFLAVILTVLAEITLLPAIAAMIGKRMFHSLKDKPQEKSAFYKAAKFSSSKAKAVAAVFLICAVPAVYFWFEAPVSYDISGELPASLPSVQALNTVNEKFGSSALSPVYVVINLTSPVYSGGGVSQAAYNQILGAENYIRSTEGVVSIIGPGAYNGTIQDPSFIFNNNRTAYFIVDLNSGPYSQAAINSVQHLRDNSSLIVGGITSAVIDLKNTSHYEYSLLEVLIVAAIGVIIGISFRSVKFPLIALSGVFISISWTLGLLYVVVTYILHESLIFLIPVILFIILMSLGNDFTVFLISRIREEQNVHGFSEGLYRGMAGSGSVVTALGVILAASLGSLGLVPIAFLQQMGLAFAISLLIDTFAIRTLYFPAMISLLGVRGGQLRKS